MSDRLAISASMSVLMMAVYVLFGAQPVSDPFEQQAFDSPVSISAPGLTSNPARFLPLSN